MRLALICAAIALAAAAGPKGSYCGGVDGIVTFRIDQINASYMNITASIFGAGLNCPDQVYKYDPSTNKISLPGLSDSKNCIGKVLADQGIDPDSVQVEYDPDSDSISIGADIGSVELEQCPKGGQLAPNGAYCGGEDGIVEMRVTILTSSVLNITFTLFGNNFICPKTGYMFDSATNALKVADITDPKSCLGKALADQGIDSASVSITFDADENGLQVQSEVGDVFLNKCNKKSAKLRTHVAPPKGAFCGGVDGILTLRVTITDASWLNVTASLFGMNFGCYKEAWKYDTATSKIILPGLTDPKDCIGKVINDQGVDPDSVAIQYDSDSDSVSIQANLGQLQLDQCPRA